MTYIRVIDFETTGMEPPEAEVCEVGICDYHIEDEVIHDPVSWLCGVKVMPPQVRAMHHIAKSDCDGQPPFDSDEMFDYDNLPGAIATHNAKYELQFFESPTPAICTYKCALRIWPDAPAHNNGTLRYWLEDAGKISPIHELTQPAHRAGPDAYVTAHILGAMFAEGYTGKQMVAWTKEPALLPTCPIGKFRGQKWADVDRGFLVWMTNQSDMDEELKWNAQRELDKRAGGWR